MDTAFTASDRHPGSPDVLAAAGELDQPHEPWTMALARSCYELPFNDLLFRAHAVHRQHCDPNRIHLSRLLNIKTGGCSEDCGYCSQSVHQPQRIPASKLMRLDDVMDAARQAKADGAQRFCMGAAWYAPKPRDEAALVAMVAGVKALGLETCMTLGRLSQAQAQSLADAGLDYYNHNIDTSRRFYPEIITTRTFDDRLATLAAARAAGLRLCCGGILGLGETIDDRLAMLVTLASHQPPPESVPLNMLVPMPGTRLEDAPPVDGFDVIRIVAVARIMMPRSQLRLAAGRKTMSPELQALCFFAGANAIFVGDRLLTTENAAPGSDQALLQRLGMEPAPGSDAP